MVRGKNYKWFGVRENLETAAWWCHFVVAKASKHRGPQQLGLWSAQDQGSCRLWGTHGLNLYKVGIAKHKCDCTMRPRQRTCNGFFQTKTKLDRLGSRPVATTPKLLWTVQITSLCLKKNAPIIGKGFNFARFHCKQHHYARLWLHHLQQNLI